MSSFRDKYYLKVLLNWSPTGRANRSEWWSYMLVHPPVSLILLFLMFAVPVDAVAITLFVAYVAVSYWIFTALTIRRLHDTGRSAWHFISPAGIMAAAFYDTVSPNQYGPVPGRDALPSQCFETE